jgi:hypothetical protein
MWIKNHVEEIEKHTKKLAELESGLSIEEKELDAIRDGLKGFFLLKDSSYDSQNTRIY